MHRIIFELRAASRALLRAPLYTVTASATLGLGIGAVALAFAFASAFFLRPMPFRDGHELVGISMTHRVASGELPDYAVSMNDYLAFQERSRGFSGIGAINQQSYAVLIGDTPESVRGGRVSASMWSVLGATPIAGRVFGDDEDRADNAIVVISATLQRRVFPGPPGDAIGGRITIDGREHVVVGVMPRGFRPRMNPGDVWMPLGTSTAGSQADSRQLQTVARRLPGVSLEAAAADVNRVARELEAERPVNREWGASTKDLRAKIGDRTRGITLGLFAAVLFMLLLTCANTANLAIARVVRRRSDIATRLALGASTTSVSRQYVLEATLIAIAGGLVGTALTAVTLPLSLSVLTSDNPLLSLVMLDWRVGLVILFAAIVAGVVASAAPAVVSARLMAGEALTNGARRSYSSMGDRRTRRLLMAVQLAAATVLLVGSVSSLSSLRSLLQTNTGFESGSLVMATVTLPTARYPGVPERGMFVSQVQERLQQTPGIERAGVTTGLFLRDNRVQSMFMVIGDVTSTQPTLAAELRRVTPTFFATLGIPVTRGRGFLPSDRDSTPPVAIVNASFARKYLDGRNPLATSIKRGALPPVAIVGVVPDVRDGGASEDPGPTVYLPFGQSAGARVTFVVATQLSAAEISGILRASVKEVDPGLPIDRIAPVESMLDESLGEERFRTVVLGTMTLLAVLIAFIGIYGVTAYLLQQNAREVAIRLALGATQSRILAQIIGGTTVWISTGVVAGVFVSWRIGVHFARRFPELAPASATVYLGVALALLAVGTFASAIPSVRASLASPSRVLRGD